MGIQRQASENENKGIIINCKKHNIWLSPREKNTMQRTNWRCQDQSSTTI